MSVSDTPVGQPDDDPGANGSLELLTDDEEIWTVVPTDAAGDDRLTQWISVESDVLCGLDDWR